MNILEDFDKLLPQQIFSYNPDANTVSVETENKHEHYVEIFHHCFLFLIPYYKISEANTIMFALADKTEQYKMYGDRGDIYCMFFRKIIPFVNKVSCDEIVKIINEWR